MGKYLVNDTIEVEANCFIAAIKNALGLDLAKSGLLGEPRSRRIVQCFDLTKRRDYISSEGVYYSVVRLR